MRSLRVYVCVCVCVPCCVSSMVRRVHHRKMQLSGRPAAWVRGNSTRPDTAPRHLCLHTHALRVAAPAGTSSMSGVVYITDDTHKQLLDEAYTLFSWTNPLHADVFPSVGSRARVCAKRGGSPAPTLAHMRAAPGPEGGCCHACMSLILLAANAVLCSAVASCLLAMPVGG